MTKKDYQLIANSFNNARQLIKAVGLNGEKLTNVLAGIDQAQLTLANSLQDDNPRFDFDKFIQACNK